MIQNQVSVRTGNTATPSVRHHVLTDAQIESIRKSILNLLSKVKRRGMNNVMHFLLKETDFFNTPSSNCGRHHNWRGGLAQHAMETYVFLRNRFSQDQYDEETLIICALFHDICKAEQYRWSSHRHRWVHRHHSSHHGSRSVQILRDKCHLALKPVEILAIGNHMHKHEHEYYFTRGLLSYDDSALCRALVEADRRSAARSSLGGTGLDDFLMMFDSDVKAGL